jgi:hypothetical protein
MTAREQAEELRQQAIQTLLEEKKAIDGMLRMLGHGEIAPPEKRRGRRPKQQEIQEPAASDAGKDKPSISGISKQVMPTSAQIER